jgi:hypothetical protein
VTYSKFHIEHPQILGTTMKYFIIQLTWPPKFVQNEYTVQVMGLSMYPFCLQSAGWMESIKPGD